MVALAVAAARALSLGAEQRAGRQLGVPHPPDVPRPTYGVAGLGMGVAADWVDLLPARKS